MPPQPWTTVLPRKLVGKKRGHEGKGPTLGFDLTKGESVMRTTSLPLDHSGLGVLPRRNACVGYGPPRWVGCPSSTAANR
jgi:hypothetical protein